MKHTFSLALFLLLFIGQSFAQLAADKYVNVNRSGVIIKGYDPVAFFTESKAVKGSENLTSNYNGAIYQFASASNKAAFDAHPEKYKVQFGGFCAWAVSNGYTASIDIDTWAIQEGRLIFNYSSRVKAKWDKDANENLKKADKNWPEIAEKKLN
ncbi:MAG: YHS domain-containing (seleno)protein [Bacteroidota bacterium]